MNSSRSHGLRTTGRPTGNFGRAKVQGKKEPLTISKEVLRKKNLVIPSKEEAFRRLEEAYSNTTDPKLRETLWVMIRARKAARIS